MTRSTSVQKLQVSDVAQFITNLASFERPGIVVELTTDHAHARDFLLDAFLRSDPDRSRIEAIYQASCRNADFLVPWADTEYDKVEDLGILVEWDLQQAHRVRNQPFVTYSFYSEQESGFESQADAHDLDSYCHFAAGYHVGTLDLLTSSSQLTDTQWDEYFHLVEELNRDCQSQIHRDLWIPTRIAAFAALGAAPNYILFKYVSEYPSELHLFKDHLHVLGL